MKRINVAIEVVDENLCAQELQADIAEEYGVRMVLNSGYADKLLLVVPEPDRDGSLPPVRLDALRAALAKFGVAVATPSTVDDVLCDTQPVYGAGDGITLDIPAHKELKNMFRGFKSNPLSQVELRGKEPADPVKRERKMRAKRFKAAFYDELAVFIAKHPSLPYTAYWDADGRPRDKQWPEYRAAVKAAKDITTN